jgi:hypothetical protein
MRTYAQGMVTEASDWELFNRQNDRAENHNVASQNQDVFARLKGEYLEWVDRELGGRPDPLSKAAEESAAYTNVERRYKQWLATEKDPDWTMKPGDRGSIDERPKGE